MSGEVGHFELPADDVKRAQAFYGKTFGWKMQSVPGMEYVMVQTGPVGERNMPSQPGYVGGGIAKRGGHIAHPVVTIVVDDLDAAAHAVEKNGGTVLQKKQPIGDGSMGFAGYFKDPEGNIVGLYQSPAK
jgi:uncharacterized protein